MPIGYISAISEEGDDLVVIVDVTEPEFISWVMKLPGDGLISLIDQL
jgi:hypothetical protein